MSDIVKILLGAIVGWGLGWAKDQLDLLRRRKSMAVALRFEITAHVGELANERGKAVVWAHKVRHLNSPLLEGASDWVTLFRPSTVDALLYYRTFLTTIRAEIARGLAVSQDAQIVGSTLEELSDLGDKTIALLEIEATHDLTADWN